MNLTVKYKYINRGIIYIIIFLYIYNVAFVFFPGILRTRILIGLYGMLLFAKPILSMRNKAALCIMGLFLISLLPILLTIIVNQEFDSRFVGNIFQNLISFWAAYFLVRVILKNNDRITFYGLIRMIVNLIVVHNFISVMMFVFEPLGQFLFNIQQYEEHLQSIMARTLTGGNRLMGIGFGSYFPGGVISGIGIILTAFLLVTNSVKNKLLYVFYFLFLTITGTLIARTCLIGVGFSLLLITYRYFIKVSNLKKIRNIISILMIILSFVWLFFLMYDFIKENILWLHAFEIFINYTESGSLETLSSNELQEMYIYPESIKTWLIGEGLFGGYYMGTDVGYLRLIYYYGLLGTIFYFLPQLYMAFLFYKENKSTIVRLLIIILVGFLLSLNFKGLVDFNWLFFLFFWMFYYKKIDENTLCYTCTNCWRS